MKIALCEWCGIQPKAYRANKYCAHCKPQTQRMWVRTRAIEHKALVDEILSTRGCADCQITDRRKLRPYGVGSIQYTSSRVTIIRKVWEATILCNSCWGKRAKADAERKYGLDAPRPCTKCGEVQPADEFYMQKAKNGGQYRHSHCKECLRTASREYQRKKAERKRREAQPQA